MMSLLSSTLFLHRSMKATQRSEWVLQKSSETLDHHPYQRSPCQEYCSPHLHTAWCSFPWCLSSELSIYLHRLLHGENILAIKAALGKFHAKKAALGKFLFFLIMQDEVVQ